MILLFLSGLPGKNSLHAQLLKDSTALNLVRKDVDYIYNQQFGQAREICSIIRNSYPGHPVVYLLRGLMTYWENYPLLATSPAHASFEEDMRQCIRISEKKRNPAYEAEYLLTNLCARGMLLKFYDDNDLTLDVIHLTTGTYKYLRHSFDLAVDCADLQYYTGTYNYYRVAYPREYPVYRPLALLFPAGNMETGLKQLQTAALSAVVLRVESYQTLSWIYSNYENKYPMALYYCKRLYELYPDNMNCLASYIKDLLLLKQYNEAERLIVASLNETKNKYYLSQLIILKGILQEKKYHEMNLAQKFYTSGINGIALYGSYGNEYSAYGYFGLSRLSELKGEKNTGKKFRGKAMKLAISRKINFD